MDASRFKRREIQTVRQNFSTAQRSIEGLRPVPARRPAEVGQPLALPAQPVANTPTNRNMQPRLDVQPVTTPTVPPAQRPTAFPQPVAPQQTAASTPPLRLPPIDMGLPGPAGHQAGPLVLKRSLWRRARHWAFISTAVVTIAIIGIGGLLFAQGFWKLHKVFTGTSGTAAALKANVDPSQLKSEGDGRINILLMGRGGGNHDGPDLADTMMLASIDPVNHVAVLVSIPRDLWVQLPHAGASKINAAWETGEFNYEGKVAPGSTDPKAITTGFNEADSVVSNVLGVNIDYNVLVDFQAFQQAVDTVGGVTVNVPTDLVDPTMAWENAGNSVLARAGVRQFDGKHALIYVRSRETTSDFARAQRQRAVLLALKDKVETLGTLSNPLKIASLMSAFGNNVATDLGLNDAAKLYSITKDISSNNITSTDFAAAPNNFVTTAPVGNQSTVQPRAGMFDYSEIQAFIRSQLKDPYITKENAKLEVLNGTPTAGVATNQANTLKSYGYNVTNVANAPTTGWTQTTVIDLSNGRDKYTRHYLEQRYKVTAATSLPDNSIPTNGADFVIIIGSDEAFTQ